MRVVVGVGKTVECFEEQSSCERGSVAERRLVGERTSVVDEMKYPIQNGDAYRPFWTLMLFGFEREDEKI